MALFQEMKWPYSLNKLRARNPYHPSPSLYHPLPKKSLLRSGLSMTKTTVEYLASLNARDSLMICSIALEKK
jgi:hypothetical protein